MLRKITEADIDEIYTYVEKSSEEAMRMPANLKELASSIAAYERLMSDIPRVEQTFPPITEKMLTLGNTCLPLTSV